MEQSENNNEDFLRNMDPEEAEALSQEIAQQKVLEDPIDSNSRSTSDFLDKEDYQAQADEMEDKADMSDSVDWAEVPEQKRQESLYHLFQKVWKAEDSSKVANLTNVELGKAIMSVRDAQHLALLATTFRHEKFAKFFRSAGEIVLATSASRRGWFAELFISQKKFTSRSVGSSGGGYSSGSSGKKKWSLFGGGATNQNQDAN